MNIATAVLTCNCFYTMKETWRHPTVFTVVYYSFTFLTKLPSSFVFDMWDCVLRSYFTTETTYFFECVYIMCNILRRRHKRRCFHLTRCTRIFFSSAGSRNTRQAVVFISFLNMAEEAENPTVIFYNYSFISFQYKFCLFNQAYSKCYYGTSIRQLNFYKTRQP